MKLLYIHDAQITSGQANLIQVLQMCNAFDNLNIEVILALPECKRDNADGFYREMINRKIGVNVNFLTITFPKITICGRLNVIGGYFGVKRLLKRIEVDICFLRNVSFVDLALKSNIPVIFESHNSLMHNRSKVLNTFWSRHIITKSKEKQFLKFITISKALANYWKSKGVPEEKIIAVHDGVDHQKFSKIKERSLARKELGLHFTQKIVVYVGSLYRDRGIDKIIKLAQCFKNALFLVIGGPEKEKKHYEDIAQKRNIKNLLFKGHVPHYQVTVYLSAADVLLMIWTKEVKTINYCSPLKMFEYMAAGRIIVGQAFPTIKEVLTDGKTAYLANPDSFENLQNKIALALEQSYPNPMAQAARTLAIRKYSWKARAQAIRDSIDEKTLIKGRV